MSYAQNRGFIFTADALLSFLIVIGLNSALVLFLSQDENLDTEYLFRVSQDAMEVCSKKADFSQGCFGILNSTGLHYSFFIGGKKMFGEDGAAEIVLKRAVSDYHMELRVWRQ